MTRAYLAKSEAAERRREKQRAALAGRMAC